MDRVGDWNTALGFGNPAASEGVKDYLSNITAEQLQARVTPLQATPLLLSDLETLSSHIFTSLLKPKLEPHQVFLLARDQAFFKAFSFREIGPLIWLLLKLRKFYVFQTIQVSS